MLKIVAAQPLELTDEQKARLEKLGEVTYFDTRASTADEWLERVRGFDVICTGTFGVREKSEELRDTFVSLPLVGVGWARPGVLKERGVVISNSPGCNRYAVAEWIVGMLLTAMRHLDAYLNVRELPFGQLPASGMGFGDKQVTILGHGNIGTIVGAACAVFGARVRYFRRGDDLAASVKGADIVVDALSVNPETDDLLNGEFFGALKRGAIFATVSAGSIVNLDVMFRALDDGTLRCVIHDAQTPGDTADPVYRRLREHERVYATPHIGYNSDVSRHMGNEMMIENIEAWVAGKPIHVVG
ncbi:MAG TPA: NAD(P)-dependent oxidoreductase [Candidatus Saccharimonadia bacterium]|nr:NAD(P)-dependent oxidoreductase [Candidatus Saccharimonadia bacterium]